jgi:hypothetical protein
LGLSQCRTAIPIGMRNKTVSKTLSQRFGFLNSQINGREQKSRYPKFNSNIKDHSTSIPSMTVVDSTPGFRITVQKLNEINQKMRCKRVISCFLM